MPAPTVLVVDDEELIRWSISERLTQDGCHVVEAGLAKDAVARLGPDIDLVLLDYRLPDSDGLKVLKHMNAAEPDVPVILLTSFSSVETAVEAMKQGAYHYANKPFNLDELSLVVQKALETVSLRREVRALRASRSEPHASVARRASPQGFELPEEGVNLESIERDLLVQALKRTGWNHTKAGALLGLNRDQIRHRIEKFGLDKTAERE
jgi:DNA-binding NtrC family response regulator